MSASRPRNLRGDSRRRIDLAHNPAHRLALVPGVGFAEAAEGLIGDEAGDFAVEVTGKGLKGLLYFGHIECNLTSQVLDFWFQSRLDEWSAPELR